MLTGPYAEHQTPRYPLIVARSLCPDSITAVAVARPRALPHLILVVPVTSEKRDSRDSNGTKEKKDAVLRKASSPTNGSFKSGQSILEQIGQPDHKGWMRKKGEHYNTWKTRYFVLKGPHMYWLKSNNTSVRFAFDGRA
jgi:hypothetical protein